MPVKIFIPKTPANEEEFNSFIKKYCNPINIRRAKNKDGTYYCIIKFNVSGNIKCANDVIKEISGKVVGDIILKPRIFVDQSLCNKLSYSSVNSKDPHDDIVNTTHFSDGFYYVQLLSEKESNMLLTSLLKNLYEEHKSGSLQSVKYDEMIINQIYATFYNDDYQFYRCKILEKFDSHEFKILFIDFGNVELVNQKVFVVNNKILDIPPMVHKCVITDIKIIDRKKEEIIAKEVLHNNYRAKLKKEKSESLKIDRVISLDYLNFSSVSYRNYLLLEDIAEEIKLCETNNGADVTKCNNGYKDDQSLVIMTHFDSLDEFYVQPVNKETEDAMNYLTSSLMSITTDINDISELKYMGPDHVYISQFSQDNNWYRCRVTDDQFDSVDSYCVVQYIDFGNSEIKYSMSDLKPLINKVSIISPDIAALPPCAMKCKFSNDLIYALSKAKMEKEYFQQNFVITEKVATFQYYFDRSNKMWIVDNIQMDNGEDIMSIVMAQCECVVNNNVDIYRLTNLEYLDKIWFAIVKSVECNVQEQLTILDKWSNTCQNNELQLVNQTIPDGIYCAKLVSGNIVRCRVIGKNIHNMIIQEIDTGLYNTIKLDSLFDLDESIRIIRPMARPFKLLLNIIKSDQQQIEDKIVQILGNSNVELDLSNDDNCIINDVIIKEKSLLQCLAQLDYIQPRNDHQIMQSTKIQSHNDEYHDLPDCLLPRVDDDQECLNVDFSLPSVENMNEVPLEIAICNGKVRCLRRLLNIRNSTNIFDELSIVVDNCSKLNDFMQYFKQVEEMDKCLDLLNGEFVNLTCNIKTRLRDFDSLIERRTTICEKICALHIDVGLLLTEFPLSKLESLQCQLARMIISLDNLLDIFHISVDKYHPIDFNIVDIQQQVAEFRRCEQYDELCARLDKYATITDEIVDKYHQMIDKMYRDYEIGDALANISSSVVPLIDYTYELHNALRIETSQYMDIFVNNTNKELTDQFDFVKIVVHYHQYLHMQQSILESIVAHSNKLQSLNQYAQLILADDSSLYHTIDDNNKRIMAFRSSLKHSIADMEDAEEQDELVKIDVITNKIGEIRRNLHVALKISRDIINGEAIKLMIRKPEFQLKNQSIFFCQEGIPVFLWDSIFFEIRQPESSVDFFHTKFSDEIVSMKKLSLTNDNYKTVLHNLTTYSSRTNISHTSKISLLPISYAFLSKSENCSAYLIVPNFVGIHQLPELFTTTIADIVQFVKCTINQILNLWHLGYTFSDNDIINGLFVILPHDPSKIFLPLPLTSILNRENINYKCQSIQVYFNRLADILQEALLRCSENVSFVDQDVQLLVTAIKNCKGVEEAEKIFKDLDQFLASIVIPDIAANTIVNGGIVDDIDICCGTISSIGAAGDYDDSSNDNASSIEHLPHEDDIINIIDKEADNNEQSGSQINANCETFYENVANISLSNENQTNKSLTNGNHANNISLTNENNNYYIIG